MSDPSKKTSSIPSWQQGQSRDQENASTDAATQSSHTELLEQARDFLKDESIRDASRDRKRAFLQKKGLQDSEIDTLLSEDHAQASTEQTQEELKTVHDSNAASTPTPTPTPMSTSQVSVPKSDEAKDSAPASPPEPAQQPIQRPERDIQPIITYPEFLLKPQKPPPLITIDRLVKATYAFVGLSTLTYGASKYIVEPMLDTMTEARHSLATTAITDLENLNNKLEGSVSHVPYIANAGASHKSKDHLRDDDEESITSDPTEFFHRDIATQTTPSLSRTQSQDSSKEHLDATTQQVIRLTSLQDTLSSLVASLDPKEVPYLPPPAHKKLHETIGDFQTVLDKLETAYNPLRGDYYSSIYAQAADKSKGGKDNDVVAKVRTEIRNLKGAFLSARNFPTAPRPVNTYDSR